MLDHTQALPGRHGGGAGGRVEASVRPGVSANTSPPPEMTIREALNWNNQAKVGQKAIFEINNQGKIIEFWALGSSFDEVSKKFASIPADKVVGRIVVTVIKPDRRD